jgi:hypothetical protein
MSSQDMHIHSANSIGGNNKSAPILLAEITRQRQYIGADVFISWIGEADQICRMNFRTFGVYMASPI